ncbi:MAG: DUF2441 domain-containing protein [Gammaproteobacteria bacterium]|nr:DUF2441 domain-containing protein [Gammaproteobacteria bacterium]
MHIENEKFYHIHKHNSSKWVESAKFTFGEEPNNAWRAFEIARRGVTNPETGEVYTIDMVAYRALSSYRKQGKKDPRLSFYHFDPVMTLAETLDSLFLSTRMIRELVYEDVRKQLYPDLPSRTTCIWLIPEESKSVRFWLDNIRGDHKKVFRVRATGEVHRANQQLILGDTISLSEWRKRAVDYWNGAELDSFDDEITFSGEVEVLQEVSLDQFGSPG